MFDLSKPYIHMEDNGDGTMTQTIYCPELVGEQVITVVMQNSLVGMMTALLPMIQSEEALDLVNTSMVQVPNFVED
jgi:hypothetical protein